MPASDPKEIFSAYDDEGDGTIDAANVGDVCRALGLKATNAQVHKAAGKEYERGQTRMKFDQFLPIYEALKKEKFEGTYNDFVEGLKVFDRELKGVVASNELQYILQAIGERLTKEQVADLFDMIKIEDADGNVSYEAFIKKIMSGPFPEEED